MPNTDMEDAVEKARAAADKLNTVVPSTVALLQSLSATLNANADEPDKIRALADELNSRADELGAAVAST